MGIRNSKVLLLVGCLLTAAVFISSCGPLISEASGIDPEGAQYAGNPQNSGPLDDLNMEDEGGGDPRARRSEGEAAPAEEADDGAAGPAVGQNNGGGASPGFEGLLNPLTGLPVMNEEWLYKRPIMVAISNFPPSAIPHTGESFAAHVFELFQGYGMTRNLAIFFGDYAEGMAEVLANRLAEGDGSNHVIGPIRSGRVVFEDVKTLYPHALLITAGASPDVKAQLSNRTSVYSQDPDDINSAGVAIDQMGSLANFPVKPEEYIGLKFDVNPPPGGDPAPFFRVIYNLYNQIGWEYSPEAGAYLRSHDKADGSGELFPETDRLTGEQLSFENIVVLFAQHRYVTPTVVEMNLVYVKDQNGILFRDGLMTPVKWSTRSGVFTIHDEEGNPIPLKPGRTFFEVVSYETTWDPDKMTVRFHEPAPAK
jgi:hypothetical protein